MLKKLIVVAGVLLVGGWLWAKTDLGSYTKTAWRQVRGCVKTQVPIEFEIKRAKDMVDSLDGESDRLINVMANQMASIERFERDIAEGQALVEREEKEIKAQNEHLKSGGTVFVATSGDPVSREQFALALERRFNKYRVHDSALQSKKESLKMHREAFDAAQAQLEAMRGSRGQLQAKIERLETDLQVVKAEEARTRRPTPFDESKLAKIKQLIEDIEKQVSERKWAAKYQGQQHQRPAPSFTVQASSPDLVQQIDGHFRTDSTGPK